MALRFRRSVKIAPGVRINFGKRGMSISAGVRGATITAGKRGVYGNVGIPGTGLSYRTKLVGKATNNQLIREQRRLERELKKQKELERRQEELSKVQLSLNDNGTLNILNSFGEALSRSDLKLLWNQKSEFIYEWLLQQAEKINGDIELLSNIHLDTPSPDLIPQYETIPFQEEPPKKPDHPQVQPAPQKPHIPKLGYFARLSPKKRKKHEIEKDKLEHDYRIALDLWESYKNAAEEKYRKELERYKQQLEAWEKRKSMHEEKEKIKQKEFPSLISQDIKLMESVLRDAINSLSWPRETIISYEIRNDGKDIWLDVDLPEIEDIPNKIATIAATRRKLNIKDKSQKQLRLEYSRHIHGIAFRLVGTTFATLPASEYVIISGYSQRLDSSTGNINDDDLFSFRVDREGFSKINFSFLKNVDPVAAMASFDHRRKMTATGIFKPITPFDPENQCVF